MPTDEEIALAEHYAALSDPTSPSYNPVAGAHLLVTWQDAVMRGRNELRRRADERGQREAIPPANADEAIVAEYRKLRANPATALRALMFAHEHRETLERFAEAKRNR